MGRNFSPHSSKPMSEHRELAFANNAYSKWDWCVPAQGRWFAGVLGEGGAEVQKVGECNLPWDELMDSFVRSPSAYLTLFSRTLFL